MMPIRRSHGVHRTLLDSAFGAQAGGGSPGTACCQISVKARSVGAAPSFAPWPGHALPFAFGTTGDTPPRDYRRGQSSGASPQAEIARPGPSAGTTLRFAAPWSCPSTSAASVGAEESVHRRSVNCRPAIVLHKGSLDEQVYRNAGFAPNAMGGLGKIVLVVVLERL